MLLNGNVIKTLIENQRLSKIELHYFYVFSIGTNFN